MAGLIALARWEFLILTGGFLAIVLFRMLSGGIRLAGLLNGGPVRLQLLAATIVSGANYLVLVIRNPRVTTLPEMPAAMLGVVALSQVFYLCGKALGLRRHSP